MSVIPLVVILVAVFALFYVVLVDANCFSSSSSITETKPVLNNTDMMMLVCGPVQKIMEQWLNNPNEYRCYTV